MTLHPFMGIKDWDKVGLSVAESSRRLHRLGYVDRKCMKVDAGHMVARPEYEVKGALGRILWQDAYHCDQLRNRCKQLRMSPVAFDKCPDSALEILMNEVLNSPDTLSLLMAIFQVVKPVQVQTIRDYLAEAQPIVDEPTIQLLQQQLPVREQQIDWGQQAIEHYFSTADDHMKDQAIRWSHYIKALIEAAGDLTGNAEKRTPSPDVSILSTPFEMPEKSTRDPRFKSSVIKFEGLHFEDNDQDRFRYMMYTRFFEMTPAEAVAYVHFQAEGRPWEFYLDTARHCWDEVRHAWFGEAALRKEGFDIYNAPNWVGWYDMSREAFTVDEAYTHLTIAIEKAAMKYPPGKREEYEFCRDVMKHNLMTTFQDFDWADEVVHAGFGMRWVINEMHGDVKKAESAAQDTVQKRKEYMANQANQSKTPEYKFSSKFAGEY